MSTQKPDRTVEPISVHSTGMPVATVVLKAKKARPFFGKHPWVLDSAIERVDGEPVDGEVVDLASSTGNWIARGIWNKTSRLRVRLYVFQPEQRLDAALLRELSRQLRLANSWDSMIQKVQQGSCRAKGMDCRA